jgi:fatty acid desaturase
MLDLAPSTHGRSEPNYEGSLDAPLAPIDGNDERFLLPRDLFERRPALFSLKFGFAIFVIGAGWLTIAFSGSWAAILPAMVVNGLMYAHLVELQHECLHGHAYNAPWLNRLFGTLCGVFMLSSYSHYRYDHLRHHAHLGTSFNKEHFNYRFQNLDSIWRFARSVFDLSRFRRVAVLTLDALRWRHIAGIDKRTYDRNIKQEYLLNAAILLGSAWWTLQSGSLLVLLAWWVPAVLVSEGVHFLIEMPEHFGLDSQTDANVLTNTRTIRTGPVVAWFVNGNDIHTAHHFHQGVPMCNVRRLHRFIEPRIAVTELSYRSFYSDVIAGRIKQQQDETCMTR